MFKAWKLKRLLNNMQRYIRTTISFPHVWITIIIVLLSVVTFYLSKHFNEIKDTYAASIYSNIFTGLITGLVLTILIGAKNAYLSIIQARCAWLTKVHEEILNYIDSDRELLLYKKLSDDDFFTKAYDTGCIAANINSLVLQSQLDKVKWFQPEKYFRKHYKYDAMERKKENVDLHIFVSNYGEDSRYREDIVKSIHENGRLLMSLNRSILQDIEQYKVKMNILAKSII